MKALFYLLFLFSPLTGYSQDTANLVRYSDGSISFWSLGRGDTSIICLYSNGKIESKRTLKNGLNSGLYMRWYDNGNLMWVKSLEEGMAEGKAGFYNRRGRKVAELNYHEGLISDTSFVENNHHLILGKLSFSSVVYGGAVREDGQADVSELSGLLQNYNMYAALVDSFSKPELIQHFKSDDQGDFFVIVPRGNIGFFPKAIDIKDLSPGEFCAPPRVRNSGSDGWDMKKPVEVKDEQVLVIRLHHSSVGYAP